MYRTNFWRLGVMLIVALGLGLSPGPAAANGNPIRIVLSYLQGVSNWGPTGAAGTAELVQKEGEVRLSATGLPRLNGEHYQLWISNTATGERLALGSFNAQADGVAKLDLVLPQEIPDKAWNLMIVSVEANGAAVTAPSSRISLAGRFPPPGSAEAKPGELPRTGGPEAAPTIGANPGSSALGPAQVAGGLAALVVVGLGGFWLGRSSVRRVR